MSFRSEDLTSFSGNTSTKGGNSKVLETIRGAIPEDSLCRMFCGGKSCKYEGVEKWKEQQAVSGVYSTWVTNNILAMARPNEDMMHKYDIIGQFKKHHIGSIFNLQRPGEHGHCGKGLVAGGGGFSYNPDAFMQEKISFYNYAWDDFGVAPLQSLIDIVQVMQFALSHGKVAVHCHAGLGRTGVLLACYLIYNNRLDHTKALAYVREKRPGSVQSSVQVRCLEEFDLFIRPLRVVYRRVDSYTSAFNLDEFLRRQRQFVHGVEGRRIKHIPKIIFVCCNRLLELAGRMDDKEDRWREVLMMMLSLKDGLTGSGRKSGKRKSKRRIGVDGRMDGGGVDGRMDGGGVDGRMDGGGVNGRRMVRDVRVEEENGYHEVMEAMVRIDGDADDEDLIKKVEGHMQDLNLRIEGWDNVEKEFNAKVLAFLLWSWLDQLKEPVLTPQDLPHLLSRGVTLRQKVVFMGKNTSHVLFFLVRMHLLMTPPPSSSSSRSYSPPPTSSPPSPSSSQHLHSNLLLEMLSSLTHNNYLHPPNHNRGSFDSQSDEASGNQGDHALISLVGEIAGEIADRLDLDLCRCCFGVIG